jgi:hypothetical protein
MADGELGTGELGVFVGRWRLRGRQYESPFGQDAIIEAVEDFSWMPGGRALVHRIDGHVGDHVLACLEVIGEVSGTMHPVTSFFGDGSRHDWLLHRDGERHWELLGRWHLAGRDIFLRCTSTADRAQRTAIWAWSPDELTWKSFWTVTASPLPGPR